MFLAALMIGNPGLPMTAGSEGTGCSASHARSGLCSTMQDVEAKLRRAALAGSWSSGGRTNLSRWFRSVERTAACAGLLLANDLGAAERMIALTRPDSAAEDVDELIRFFTAGRCSLLRRRIGIAVA